MLAALCCISGNAFSNGGGEALVSVGDENGNAGVVIPGMEGRAAGGRSGGARNSTSFSTAAGGGKSNSSSSNSSLVVLGIILVRVGRG